LNKLAVYRVVATCIAMGEIVAILYFQIAESLNTAPLAVTFSFFCRSAITVMLFSLAIALAFRNWYLLSTTGAGLIFVGLVFGIFKLGWMLIPTPEDREFRLAQDGFEPVLLSISWVFLGVVAIRCRDSAR
jgi:hypothetical protein